MKDLEKNSIPAAILVGCLILGGFYYSVQSKKQNSIEKQQQVALQATIAQQDVEFKAKQKSACMSIYETENKKWNNVNGWRYDESEDDCFIEYKLSPKLTEAQCDAKYKDENGKLLSGFAMDWFLCKDGLFEKMF